MRRLLAVIGVSGLVLTGSLLAFNNDGETDILWRNYSDGNNTVWYMNDATLVSIAWLMASTDLDWKMVGTGDFNNDGQLDIVWRHATTGLNAAWFMNGSTFLTNAWIETVSDLNWEIVGTGYFHHLDPQVDTGIDLLWRNKSDGQNAIWFMSGTNRINNAMITSASVDWKVGGTGDFNDDGQTDIIWRNANTGQNAVWFMNGTNLVSSGLFQGEPDTNWEIVSANFFNSGNQDDLLWRHKTIGDNAVWFMNGTNLLGASLITSTNTNWKVGGTGDSKMDSDSDGMADLWERNYFGTLNRDGSGDYDGDGITDLQEYQNGTNPTAQELRVRIARPQSGSNLP